MSNNKGFMQGANPCRFLIQKKRTTTFPRYLVEIGGHPIKTVQLWTDVEGMKLAAKGDNFFAWKEKQSHTSIQLEVDKNLLMESNIGGAYYVSPAMHIGFNSLNKKR
ncbi:hypothetical protein JUJ52_03000 [Virgibacillus sp. AGTR]|uniref:hypothetical protein n=1 Tax=Virgibacillus sp. AGTR TaxID=2812055 RepID=UPI001D15E47C|nr:hypothetical protein [Virgibacillus sp. AGTR]MCC2248925.1 hypothetical protein [Virgibacillus sp. AGTR]